MKLLAIDQATTAGYCLGEIGERPRWGSVRLRGDGLGIILADYRRWLVSMIRENQPRRVIFETPYVARPGMASRMNATTLRRLMYFAGCIEEVCATMQANGQLASDTRCLEVTTAEVSKFLMLPGRMKREQKKAATLHAIRSHYGFPVGDDNAADAVAIWLIAEATIAPVIAQRRGVGPLQLGRNANAAPPAEDGRVRLS